MWCKTCQQDVPSVATTDLCGFVCPRCGGTTGSGERSPDGAEVAQVCDDGIDLSRLESLSEYAACELKLDEMDDQLRQVDRLLKQSGTWTPGDGPDIPLARRVDLGDAESHRAAVPSLNQPVSGGAGFPAAGSSRPAATQPVRTVRRRATSPLSWALVALGLFGFGGGATLLVLSWILPRPEIWNLGLMVTAGGQFTLLMSLLMRLERVWTYQRATCERLIEVDAELNDVRRTADLLSTKPNNPAEAFYTHLAHGASPHMLLTDVQGQLSLVAQRLAAERKL